MGRATGKTVAVAIDRDKGSQTALKWATENVVEKGRALILIHVQEKAASMPPPRGSNVSVSSEDRAFKKQVEIHSKGLFTPFRCFCSRKDIRVEEVLLEDTDVARAIVDYVKAHSIDVLVTGSAMRSGFLRFKGSDIPTNITKAAPDFCSVYVISKGKVSATRSRNSGPIGTTSRRQQLTNQASHFSDTEIALLQPNSRVKDEHKTQSSPGTFRSTENGEYKVPFATQNLTPRAGEDDKAPLPIHNVYEDEEIKSPFDRAQTPTSKSPGNHSPYESYITFNSSGRPSTELSSPSYDNKEYASSQGSSNSSGAHCRFFEAHSGPRSSGLNSSHNYTSSSGDSGGSWSSQNKDDVEAEMIRLKLELKKTMDMYSTAYNEALSAKQKTREVNRWKLEEEQRIGEAQLAEESALALVEVEKAKCRAAIEAAEAAQRIAEREAQKRLSAELKAHKESEEKKKAVDALAQKDVRYRKYTIEEIETATNFFQESHKIGEGGYGPVYKCYLDHTLVAVKALRPDAAHGRSQFQQEVEVLSCIRHPNMVLLLGACPEYGCLVYEYMANGSLEDRLFRRGNTPVLPWQHRFRIAAEIGTGLLFLHQTKPEPLVHRDLKPANILLDHNYVSKISDVGLARLVPPSTANSVTQYRMTAAAGTFCYIDPEYQQTGLLGKKSDVYSLGIVLLQIITAKPPMGLAYHVEESIESRTFAQILDPAVSDWPLEETLSLAKLALRCAELRRKDRPDLATVVLPDLNRLQVLAEQSICSINLGGSPRASPTYSQFSRSVDKMSDSTTRDSGYNSLGSCSTTLSMSST